MYCWQCGAQNPDGAARCVACGAAGAMPVETKPKNYLVETILLMLCCNPLAIVGIFFALQVNTKWEANDKIGASELSAKLRKWLIIAFVVGLVANIVLLVFQIYWAMGMIDKINKGGSL